MKPSHCALFGAALAATLLSWSASAATIAHWRFEPGAFYDDSSGNGFTLNPSGTVVEYPLPATGPGSAFDRVIPLTRAANTAAANFGAQAGALFVEDSPPFSVSDFTIEAYVHRSANLANTGFIVSQWAIPGNQRSWGLAFNGSTATGGRTPYEVMLTLSQVGTGTTVIPSGLVTSPNTDYYVAASITFGGSIVFYLKDLTTGGPLQMATVPNPLPSILDSTANVRIGEQDAGGNRWNGLIDEVRLSSGILATNELLIWSPPGVAPTIGVAPQDQAVAAGGTATFSVTASGTPPLFYLWFEGNTLLSAGESPLLVLPDVALAQNGGQYRVVVTNLFGSVTSSPAATLTVVDVSSPTVGYWRFENAGQLGQDSSTNGIHLSDAGQQVARNPNFLDPIPLTGAANSHSLFVDSVNFPSCPDWPAFAVGDRMTIEVMFNASVAAINQLMPLASQWDQATPQRGWVLGLLEATPFGGDLQLRFAVSANGVNATAISANRWTLVPGNDYYAAVVYEAGDVTFYFADLSTNNPALQAQTFSGLPANIHNSTADFRIGARQANANPSLLDGFYGTLDEVRLSRVALAPGQLLLNNLSPEPPSIVTPPASVMAGSQESATFSVAAVGAPPLHYQWYAGDTPISGATAARLTLTQVALEQTGSYSVVVTNAFGSATGGPATLTVVDISNPVVGYWRFENAGQLGWDSSGNGMHLTNEVGALASVPVANAFARTIPLTGATNEQMLELDGASVLGRAAAWGDPDWITLGVRTQLTVEAFFNLVEPADNVTHMIASKWVNGSNQRSWFFGMRENNTTAGVVGSPRLRFGTSDGSNTTAMDAGSLVVESNRDYYAAVVFNAGTATYYLADLSTTPVVLQSQTVSGLSTPIFRSDLDFRVGAQVSTTNTPGDSVNFFNGTVDEVRVSRVALSPAQLLINRFGGGQNLAVRWQPGEAVLSGEGMPGTTYSVLRSTEAAQPMSQWSVLGSATAAGDGSISFTDTNAPWPGAYYRLRQP